MSGARDAQSERLSKTSFSLKRVEVEEKGLNDRDQHNDLLMMLRSRLPAVFEEALTPGLQNLLIRRRILARKTEQIM